MIKFEYDPEQENGLTNWYVEKKGSAPAAMELKKYNNEISLSPESDFIKKHIEWISNNWKNIEENFLLKLGEFYERKLMSPDLTCYLVRINRFPYDYGNEAKVKWFAAPLFDQPSSRTRVIMHELVHYFQPVELPYNIKEAIPTILNDHKTFQMWAFDQGNENEEEQKWRKIIWDIYSSGGKFSDVLKIVQS